MKTTFFSAMMLMATSLSAQDVDPVVMRVNGRDITRSEFEYSFNKNNADGVLDKKDLNDYIPLFENFQLKVEAAKEARLDTLSSIRKEINGYREQMILPYIVDTAFIEKQAQETYEATKKRFGGDDILKASHILLLLRQNDTEEKATEVKNRIDSIYQAITGGADFSELARKYSSDRGSAAQGGLLPEFGKGMMVPEFEAEAYKLQPGQLSQPFKTAYGYHIIQLHDRHPFEPYEFHHDAILQFLKQQGIEEYSSKQRLDSLVKTLGKSREEVVADIVAEISAKDSEIKYLDKEYNDGSLMFEISRQEVWSKGEKDIAGLDGYFKTHKKDFAWTEPHFRGIIVHAKDDKVIKDVAKVIKGVNEDEWVKVILNTFNNDSVKQVSVEKGIFKKGDNSYVDYRVFGGPEKSMRTFPVTATYGKTLKAPQTYKDVLADVTTAYQNELEKAWVARLREKYPVEVFEDALQTVNNH